MTLRRAIVGDPRRALIAMSAMAVIGDAMLMPFLPQFFAARYATTSPNVTGLYLAAVCGIVMAALPLWARLARQVHALRILVATQAGAAALALASASAPTLAAFCALSLAMFACKASYLLMYPCLLGLEEKTEHAHTIGLLSVIVHFGAIAGALLGGGILQVLAARDVLGLMAVSDLVQAAICWPLARAVVSVPAEAAATPAQPADRARTNHHRLLTTMLVCYFGMFIIRPFFGSWWMHVSGIASPLVAGAVFAMPALVALVGLAVNRRRGIDGEALRRNLPGDLAIGIVGLLLQAVPHVATILVGRCVYGWSVFQVTVALDAILFAASWPERYAIDYGKANIAQNAGVVAAAATAGALVAATSLAAPFLVAATALGATALLAWRPARAVTDLAFPSPTPEERPGR